MAIVSKWCLAFAGLLNYALAAPLTAKPGDIKDIEITEKNTLNGTFDKGHATYTSSVNAQLPLIFTNNFASGPINVYVTGLDVNNQIVFLLGNGQWYYPPGTASTIPIPVTSDVSISLGGQGSSTQVTLPDYISSGRIWVAAGSLTFFVVANVDGQSSLVEPSAANPADPSANINWGIAELTYIVEGIYADISYVDFVGMPVGLTLQSSDAGNQSALGVDSNAVASICSALQAQGAADGQGWNDLCVTDGNGNPIRVLAPYDAMSVNGGYFSSYWTDYVNQVWTYYSSNSLTIDTQTNAGDVTCQVSGDTLICDGDNRGYAKPSAADIFGCNSGPFAIQTGDNDIHKAVIPRLCAAFDRTTLLLEGGNLQPSLNSSDYYTTAPTNYYSKFVHEHEVGGTGYAFAYDDVAPSGDPGCAGLVTASKPTCLEIIIGGSS
jgi:hypothetical protein